MNPIAEADRYDGPGLGHELVPGMTAVIENGAVGEDDLPVALSAPEIRRLIATLQALTQAAWRFILDWSLWRRCHQAIARRCHWKRRATHRRPHHKTQL
jgi:hypothetical protein